LDFPTPKVGYELFRGSSTPKKAILKEEGKLDNRIRGKKERKKSMKEEEGKANARKVVNESLPGSHLHMNMFLLKIQKKKKNPKQRGSEGYSTSMSNQTIHVMLRRKEWDA